MNNIANRLGTVGLWGEAREEILRLRAELADASEKLMIAATDRAGLRAELAAVKKLLDEASPYVAQDDNGNYRHGTIEKVLLGKIRYALGETNANDPA